MLIFGYEKVAKTHNLPNVDGEPSQLKNASLMLMLQADDFENDSEWYLPDSAVLRDKLSLQWYKLKRGGAYDGYDGFEVAEKGKYYVLRKARDDEASQMYLNILDEEDDGLYIQDMMRGGVRNDDPRIPRNIPE